jgi:hypothetical protein
MYARSNREYKDDRSDEDEEDDGDHRLRFDELFFSLFYIS